jgi:hypothetical protein
MVRLAEALEVRPVVAAVTERAGTVDVVDVDGGVETACRVLADGEGGEVVAAGAFPLGVVAACSGAWSPLVFGASLLLAVCLAPGLVGERRAAGLSADVHAGVTAISTSAR